MHLGWLSAAHCVWMSEYSQERMSRRRRRQWIPGAHEPSSTAHVLLVFVVIATVMVSGFMSNQAKPIITFWDLRASYKYVWHPIKSVKPVAALAQAHCEKWRKYVPRTTYVPTHPALCLGTSVPWYLWQLVMSLQLVVMVTSFCHRYHYMVVMFISQFLQWCMLVLF